MIITIGGLIGSGKTTLAERISKKFKFRHISAGEIMREMAKDRGMYLLEFSRYAESNPEIDRKIDKRQKKLAVGKDCVVDGRLSAHFLKPELAVYLNAPLDVRAKRIMKRDGIRNLSEAKRQILNREKSERKRYESVYGINIDDMEIYDIIINTMKFDINVMTNIIYVAIKNIR